VIALAGSVLVASLLGSPHCAGMCGGFVCFYSGQDERGRAWAHVAYNLGRLASYLALGLLAGAAGRVLDRAGAAAGLQRGAAMAAGLVMVAWGAAAIARALGARVSAPAAPGFLRARFAGAMKSVAAQPPEVRALALGLVTTLLPCGWLWIYVATAAGTGTVSGALLVMGAFWLGTVPVMAGLGLVAQRAFGPLRRRLPLLTAGILVVLGLLTLGGKLQPVRAGGASCPQCAPAAGHAGH
jgi:sulfite exporter TauE/SafE